MTAPNLGIGEWRGHRREIGFVHPHVAVGDEEKIIFRRRDHIVEIAGFEVVTRDIAVDDQRDIDVIELPDQALDRRNGRIGRVQDAKDDLISGIGLTTERAKIFVKQFVHAANRLENSDGRLEGVRAGRGQLESFDAAYRQPDEHRRSDVHRDRHQHQRIQNIDDHP